MSRRAGLGGRATARLLALLVVGAGSASVLHMDYGNNQITSPRETPGTVFVAPNLDALPEALLKAQGRGAIAAFSPSGLSLDGPAHKYHRALVQELASGTHQRLGDAVLAAQKTYAQTGLLPELLTVYQLLGDPAMRIR